MSAFLNPLPSEAKHNRLPPGGCRGTEYRRWRLRRSSPQPPYGCRPQRELSGKEGRGQPRTQQRRAQRKAHLRSLQYMVREMCELAGRACRMPDMKTASIGTPGRVWDEHTLGVAGSAAPLAAEDALQRPMLNSAVPGAATDTAGGAMSTHDGLLSQHAGGAISTQDGPPLLPVHAGGASSTHDGPVPHPAGRTSSARCTEELPCAAVAATDVHNVSCLERPPSSSSSFSGVHRLQNPRRCSRAQGFCSRLHDAVISASRER